MDAGLLDAKKCGTCRYTKIVPQDVTKRACFGMPPTALQVPGPQGQVSLRMARPVVSVSDDACALHQYKSAIQLSQDNGMGLVSETKQ